MRHAVFIYSLRIFRSFLAATGRSSSDKAARKISFIRVWYPRPIQTGTTESHFTPQVAESPRDRIAPIECQQVRNGLMNHGVFVGTVVEKHHMFSLQIECALDLRDRARLVSLADLRWRRSRSTPERRRSFQVLDQQPQAVAYALSSLLGIILKGFSLRRTVVLNSAATTESRLSRRSLAHIRRRRMVGRFSRMATKDPLRRTLCDSIGVFDGGPYDATPAIEQQLSSGQSILPH